MKILVAVPTFETIFPDVFKAIYELEKPEGVEVMFDFIRGYDCATARNNIIITAQNKGAEYVLMIDNDVIPPKDTLIHFLEDPKEVCLGFYAHRDTDNIYRGRTCICRKYDDNGDEYFNYPLESEYTEQDMKEFRNDGEYKVVIHGGGMGCAFIHLPIIDHISYPWYDWVNYNDDNRGMLSEDLFFCEQLKRIHIPIYTDTRVGCKHILRHAQAVM